MAVSLREQLERLLNAKYHEIDKIKAVLALLGPKETRTTTKNTETIKRDVTKHSSGGDGRSDSMVNRILLVVQAHPIGIGSGSIAQLLNIPVKKVYNPLHRLSKRHLVRRTADGLFKPSKSPGRRDDKESAAA